MVSVGERVLLLGAHTDDVEWGCGATVSKLARRGAELRYLAFSAAEESVRPEYAKDILRHEVKLGAGTLGISQDNIEVLRFPVRRFPEYRQEILEVLVRVARDWRPDLVFVHATEDTHQDHETLSRESFRAFKRTRLLGYEISHNHRSFAPSFFSVVSEADLDAKVRALESYSSQRWRLDDPRSVLSGLASVRGAQIGERYAEGFEVMRWRDG
jgi:LmbE family N-acetylglucosaminyl deacetylase